mgnify:CR=1 FL=1
METIINNLISKLLDQRKDLIYELKNLDPHLMNYSIKKMDLSQEISQIDFQIQNHLITLSSNQNLIQS